MTTNRRLSAVLLFLVLQLTFVGCAGCEPECDDAVEECDGNPDAAFTVLLRGENDSETNALGLGEAVVITAVPSGNNVDVERTNCVLRNADGFVDPELEGTFTWRQLPILAETVYSVSCEIVDVPDSNVVQSVRVQVRLPEVVNISTPDEAPSFGEPYNVVATTRDVSSCTAVVVDSDDAAVDCVLDESLATCGLPFFQNDDLVEVRCIGIEGNEASLRARVMGLDGPTIEEFDVAYNSSGQLMATATVSNVTDCMLHVGEDSFDYSTGGQSGFVIEQALAPQVGRNEVFVSCTTEALETIDVPAVIVWGGDFDSNTNGNAIIGAQVITGSLQLTGVSDAQMVPITAVRQLGGDIMAELTNIGTFELPGLQYVHGEISIAANVNMGSIILSNLESVRGHVAIATMANADYIDLEALRTVTGNFRITDLDALTTINLALESVSGFFEVSFCPALETLNAPDLVSTKNLRIFSNPSVTAADFSKLIDVEEGFVFNNTGIDSADGTFLQGWAAGITVSGTGPIPVGLTGHSALSCTDILALSARIAVPNGTPNRNLTNNSEMDCIE